MNKRLLLLPIVLISAYELRAHKQHVHQYIVREAYELLRGAIGRNIPEMHNHVGGLEPFYAGDHAWQRPFVTTGAWREDEEDVVYGYRNVTSVLNDYALVSITHFWDADAGDFTPNMFRVHPVPLPITEIGPYENAYQKLLRYATGGWILWYPHAIHARNKANGHSLEVRPSSGVPVTYQSLTSFYRSRTLRLRPDQDGSYSIFDETDQKVISPEEVEEVEVDGDTRDRITWEILGRMCHLLGDMSCPAHAHGDEHGLDPDDYEEWMGGASEPYLEWSHQNVGDLIDPVGSSNDLLHFLMYTMQQKADRFGSNGPYAGDGDEILGGNPRAHEVIRFASVEAYLPMQVHGETWSLAHLENIRDNTFPHAILSTAGLLYWFAKEAGLLPPTDAEFVTSGAEFDVSMP